MSPILVLTGLLVIAFFASLLVRGRGLTGFGLPSGTEFLLVGIFVGPKLLGLVSRSTLASFEVLTTFALAWLALVTGIHFGWREDRRVAPRRMLAGFALALGTLAAVTLATFAVARLTTDLGTHELFVLSLGVGAVSTETTRHAVRWVAERHAARGPLSELISDVAEADDAAPLLALTVLAAAAPSSGAIQLGWPAWTLVLATLASGAVMGATCAALVDVEPRPSQRWGILLGTALLTVGAAMRMGLASISAAFVMGVVTSRLARERAALHEMVSTTERAIMLPALVLAGTYVELPPLSPFVPIAALALAVRFGAKVLWAHWLLRVAVGGSSGAVTLGLGLMPAGVLTVTVGLFCSLRLGGRAGDLVLAVAVVSAVFGEIFGATMLRRALRRAGEGEDVASQATPLPAPRRKPAPRRWGSRGARGSLPGVDGRGR